MNLRDVVTFIVTDSSVTNDGIDAVITAIRERQKINRASERAVAQATLRVGMKVRLEGLTPKFWNGTEGVITSFNQTHTRATIRVTKSSHAFKIIEGSTQSGFPLTTLIPTEETANVTDAETTALMDFINGIDLSAVEIEECTTINPDYRP